MSKSKGKVSTGTASNSIESISTNVALAATTISPYSITQGSFAVDANGQATYSVPIAVPPGINGATPSLSLTYAHQSRNGVLGVGWNISGLSYITRINANMATDGFIGGINYDANDRFSLDGSRLINMNGVYGSSGAVYYTEINSWQKVVSLGAPNAGFIVYSKDGTKSKYGTTADSLIFAAGSTTNVRCWALASIEDLNGNVINYTYTKTPIGGLDVTENFYISSITYGKSKVSFSYSSRSDVLISYLGGSRVTTSCLLSSIKTQINSSGSTFTDISTYTLNYDTSVATNISRLSSVVLSDASNNEMPPITFGWQDVAPSDPVFDINQVSRTLSNLSGLMKTIPIDATGEGLTDIAQIYEVNNKVLKLVVFTASLDSSGNLSYIEQTPVTLGAYPSGYKILTGDVNGTGITDLIIVYPYGPNNTLHIDVFSADDAFNFISTTDTGDVWQGKNSIDFYVIEANGDGRADLVEAFKSGPSAPLLSFNTYQSNFTISGGVTSGNFQSSIYTQTSYIAPQSNKDLFAMDVNGDGMVDMVLRWKDKNSSVNITSFVTQDTIAGDLQLFSVVTDSNLNIGTEGQIGFFPADVNSDGILDLVQISSSGDSSLVITSIFSDCKGGFVAGPSSKFNESIDPEHFYPMGLNGRSQTSMLNCWLDTQGKWNFTVYSSSPNGTFYQQGDSINSGTDIALQFFMGDPCGTGKAGIFYTYLDKYNNSAIQPIPSNNTYPDLITSITDMLGAITSISYAPLSDQDVYSSTGSSSTTSSGSPLRFPTHLAPAQYPQMEVLGQAIYVVDGYSISNNSSINRFAFPTITKTMHYSDAHIDLSGRGWQGFNEISSLDMNTGLIVTNTYNQDFPYTGTTFSTRTEAYGPIASLIDPKVPSGSTVLLKRNIQTFQYTTFTNQSPPSGVPVPTSYNTLNTASLQYEYDYGDANFKSLVSTVFTYDTYSTITKSKWNGYTTYVNPDAINPYVLPTLTPITTSEVVYTHRSFTNNVGSGQYTNSPWYLGYTLTQKESVNATDSSPSTFVSGDFNLTTYTYNTTTPTYNLLTQSVWDSSSSVFLTTTYTYNSYGNVLTKTEPGSRTYTYTYETYYNIYPTSETSPPNNSSVSLVTYFGYDPRFGKKVATKDPNGFINVLSLDGFGRDVYSQSPIPVGSSQSDTNLVTSLVTGNTSNMFTSATVLTFVQNEYLSDTSGNIYVNTKSLQTFPTTSARDFAWTKKYTDALSRTAQQVTETGQSQGDSFVLTNYNSPSGQEYQQSVPFFSTSASPSLGTNPCTTTSYDVLGRPLTKTVPHGPNGASTVTNTIDYTYDTNGNSVITTKGADSTAQEYVQTVSSHCYNGKLRQIKSVIPNDSNATTTFVFDAIGRMLSTTDPIGIINTLTYDSLNRKLTSDNLDQNTVGGSTKAITYSYSSTTGELSTTTDAASKTVSFTYDKLGRVLQKSFSADSRIFVYTYDNPSSNSMGKLSKVEIYTNNTISPTYLQSSKVFTYDQYGNTLSNNLSVKLSGATSTFLTQVTYDPMNRAITKTLPDSSVTNFTYTKGALTSQLLGNARIDYPLDSYTASGISGQYNCYNQSVSSTNPLLQFTYSYSPTNILYTETLVKSPSGAPSTLLNYTNTFDNLNQLLTNTESINSITNSYTYQNKKLTAALTPGSLNPNTTYQYDKGANITYKDGNQYTSYNAHFVKQVKDSSNNQIYAATQDSCGRTSTRIRGGITLKFEYDGTGAVNKITDITVPATPFVISTTISDDSGSRLVEVQTDKTTGNVTTSYYPDSSYTKETLSIISPSSTTTTIKKYLSDAKGQAASIVSVTTTSTVTTISFYRRDHKGNITQILDGNTNGNIINKIVYDAFGLPNAQNPLTENNPLFEGKTYDQLTNLYYFGARYYDPIIGVFITPDTQLGGSSIFQYGVLNRFAFEANNPVCYVDPTGHFNWNLFGMIVAAVALVVVAVAVTVVTAGIAGPAAFAATTAAESALAGAVIGATVGAGIAGIVYASQNKDDLSWKDYGITIGINAGIGAAGGAASGGVGFGFGSAGMKDTISNAVARIALHSVVQGTVWGATGLLTQLSMNGVTDTDLEFGLGQAFGIGFASGFVTTAVVEGGISAFVARNKPNIYSIELRRPTPPSTPSNNAPHVPYGNANPNSTVLLSRSSMKDVLKTGILPTALRSIGVAIPLGFSSIPFPSSSSSDGENNNSAVRNALGI